jgi:hypothetical protein
VSDINTAVVDSLKVLDPNRPIREADIPKGSRAPDEVFSRDTPPEAMTLANMCGGAVEPLPLKSH